MSQIIELITVLLVFINDMLEKINLSPIPEQAGIVLAKTVRFTIDNIFPLINDIILTMKG